MALPSFLPGTRLCFDDELASMRFGSQYAGVRNGRDDAHHDY